MLSTRIQKPHTGFEPKISLDEATKSTNSQTNNKSPGNDCLTAEVYKHFSNELSLILLNIYHSREKFDTVGAISGTGIISVMYKFRL